MKKTNQKNFCITICLFILFALWTIAVRCLDVQPIGPNGSSVGLAGLNGLFHRLTGVHMLLYTITDWLGLVPFCFVAGFALLGLKQMIERRSIIKVDGDILLLGGFYVLVMIAYVLFEVVIVNYRPVLIEGVLEASYPSSTTLLVLCVIPTAILQFGNRIKNKKFKYAVIYVLIAFTVFMVVGRLISGVHWLSDIIGGILLSMGLVILYYSLCNCIKNRYD